MKLFSKILDLLKFYKKDLINLKLLILLIINAWLFFIFWDVILLKSNDITNDNIALTQILIILEPLLHWLGLNLINSNILKMLIILIIVILSNLIVLYFNQMLAIILLGMTARYSYKAYSNYTNKDLLNYYGFEQIQEPLDITKVLNDFIVEHSITDPSLILFLENKIKHVTCVNKNELLLTLNNSFLDYKQQLLSKLILHQKDQIAELQSNQKAPTWSWDSIDYWTLLKIGSGIIVVAFVVIGGYYYFSHDTTKTVGDITKKVGEDASTSSISVSDIDKLLTNYRNLAEGLQIESNNNMTALTKQFKSDLDIVIKDLKVDTDSVKELKELTEVVVGDLKNIYSDLAEVQNEQAELASTLIDFKAELGTSLSTGLAVLTFLGFNVELDNMAADLIQRMRDYTGRENVYVGAAAVEAAAEEDLDDSVSKSKQSDEEADSNEDVGADA